MFNDKRLFYDLGTVNVVEIESADGIVSNVSKGGMTMFGFAYYWEAIPMNILSFGCMVDSGLDIQYMNKQDTFHVGCVDNSELVFGRTKGRLYVSEIAISNNYMVKCRNNNNNNDNNRKNILMTTIYDKMAKYSKIEVKRAERVKELMWRFGVMSISQLVKQLKLSKIEEANCGVSDIIIANDIWGADLAGLKGKSTAVKNKPIPIDVIRETAREVQTCYGDIMFWLGKPYLLLVSEPLDLLAVSLLNNRTEEELYRVTIKLLRKPIQAGFKYSTLYFDREAGTLSEEFKNKLLNMTGVSASCHMEFESENTKRLSNIGGMEVEHTGATAGIDKIERRIRTVKERCRGIVNVLPYELPECMEESLVLFTVARINSEIKGNSNDNRSPRERLNGRTNNKSWIRHGFGDYVQVHSENSNRVGYNGAEGRTIGALSLYPIDNVMGTWAYLSLSTWQLIHRNRGTGLPMTDNVIETINMKSIKYMRKEDDDGDNNEIESVSDQHTESAVEIFPNVIDENYDNTYSEGVESYVGAMNGVNGNEPEASMGAEDIQNYGIINDTIDGVSVRRSARIRDNNLRLVSCARTTKNKKRKRMKDYEEYTKVRKVFMAKKASGTMSVKEGINKLGYDAVKAVVLEMTQLVDKDVLEGRNINDLSLSELKKIITCRMFLKEKINADGVFEKVKARLVAGGHLQDREIYNNGSSPTASTTVVFMEAAIAAKLCNAVAHIDFSGAFLNADMPKTGNHVVNMRLDKYLTSVLVKIAPEYEEFVEGDGTIVCRLNKALYGTIEAARLWYEMFVNDALKFGYVVNEVDMCVFRRTESDGSVSVLVLHVDDLFIRAANESTVDSIIKQWDDKYPGVTAHRGRRIEYLGMVFDFNVSGEVTIYQKGFIEKLLGDCSDMNGTAETPTTGDYFKIDNESKLLSSSLQERFHSVTQSLLYLSKRTRPDIQIAVGFLGRRVKKATEEDWNKISRVIRFIRGTIDAGLRLRCGNGRLKVTVFIDASHAIHDDYRSHTGCCLYIGDMGAVYCKSSRQGLNTKSSAESELVGATDLAGAYIWVHSYLKAQNYDVEYEVDLRQDNLAVHAWLKNGRAKDDKGRHINIRYFWLADRIKRGELVVNYTNTSEMVADYLSKPLTGALFNKFRNMIQGYSTWKV